MIPNIERGGASFTLSKWYFDCIASDGRIVVGYWASLAWRGYAANWQCVALHEPGKPAVHRSALVSSPAPDMGPGRLTWHAPALCCVMDYQSVHQPIAERLMDDNTGALEWHAQVPAGSVAVSLRGEAPMRGLGYAGRILLTVLPWQLPIRELRCGRWMDADAKRYVVWMDWRGEAPRTWVFTGSASPVRAAVVTDKSVTDGAFEVVLGKRQTLDTLPIEKIVSTVAPLKAALPKTILALRHTRWCTDATLREGNAEPVEGNAIHDVVVFR